MGRIKPRMIKRLGAEIANRHPEDISESFDANKKLTAELTTVSSKKLRNKTAGYLCRLAKRQ